MIRPVPDDADPAGTADPSRATRPAATGAGPPWWWGGYRLWSRLVRSPYLVAGGAGVAVVAAVAAAELSRALAGPVGPDGRGYGATAVFAVGFPPTDTGQLAAALGAWSAAATDGVPTPQWFLAHAVATIVLAGATVVLVGAWLERVTPGSPPAGAEPRWHPAARRRALLVGVPPVVVGLLLLLTTSTAVAVLAPASWSVRGTARATEVAAGPLALVTTSAFASWLAIVTVGLLGLRLWLRERGPNDDPSWSAAGALDWLSAAREDRDRTGRPRPTPVAATLGGLLTVVAAFAALVALPLGGPGQQIPDVVRGQLTGDAGMAGALRSLVPLLLFAGTVYLAGLVATSGGAVVRTRRWRSQRGRLLGSVALVAALAGVGLAVPRLLGDDRPALLPPLALALTVTAVSLLGVLAHVLTRLVDEVSTDRQDRQDRLPETADDGATAEVPQRVPPASWRLARRAWVTGLAAAVLVVGAIGILRALFPVFVYSAWAGVPVAWYVALTAVAVLAVVALVPTAVWLAVRRPRADRAGEAGQPEEAGRSDETEQSEEAGRWDETGEPGQGDRWDRWDRWPMVLAALAAAALLVGAAWLTVEPSQAWLVGSNGALTLAVGLLALLVAALAWLWRRAALPATRSLGLGPRTPWLALLVVSFLLAGLLDTRGGYHDVRLYRSVEPPVAAVEPGEAFADWAAAAEPCGRPDSVPLLLVAAPGGGIAAAYWTALGLDTLTERCSGALFAVSGVSGGAVGATAALAGEPGTATQLVRQLSEDRALAATVAAGLLRDVPATMWGVRRGWQDRAAFFEDGLLDSAAGTLGSRGEPLSFDQLGQPWREAADSGSGSGSGASPGFAPLVVLTAASVWDGCRVLLTTAAELPATGPDAECARNPVGGVSPPGPVTRAVDGRTELLNPLAGTTGDWSSRWPETQPGTGEECPAAAVPGPGTGPPPQLSAVTAAGLSARFPYLAPTGALRRCVDRGGIRRVEVTYAVDGGYLENQGILTALQLWSAVEPYVRACNALATAGSRVSTGSRILSDDPDEPDVGDSGAGAECPRSPGSTSGGSGELLTIEPWLVELDPKYRSPGAPVPTSQPNEAIAPVLTALRSGTVVDVPALRQGAAAAFRPDPTVPTSRSGGYATFSPGPPAGITPPLGWVLSGQSRSTLEAQRACAAARLPSRLAATLDLPASATPPAGCTPGP